MALPVSVTLVALATKLFRISPKHRLDRRGPARRHRRSKLPFELLKPLRSPKAATPAYPLPAPSLAFILFNLIRFVMASISSLSRFAIRNLKPKGMR